MTTAYLITSTISHPAVRQALRHLRPQAVLHDRDRASSSSASCCARFARRCTSSRLSARSRVSARAALISLALAIIGDIVRPGERAKYQGYFLAVFGTSSVLGPVHRRSAGRQPTPFSASPAGAGSSWINVPIGLLALVVVIRVLHLPASRTRAIRIDWWGAVVLVVGLVPLLIVAEQGREWGWVVTSALPAT